MKYKLALMSLLPTLCVYENLEYIYFRQSSVGPQGPVLHKQI